MLFGLIGWLLAGLIAGALAKMITPQKESGGWISSIIIGIIGSIVGGILARMIGLGSFSAFSIGGIAIATGGAVLVLFIYHRYFAAKWKLPI